MKMNTLLNIRFDTARNKADLNAYDVAIGTSDKAPTGRLIQRGGTFNNVVSYEGVFATRPEAFRALFDYIDAPCSIVELTGPHGVQVKVVGIGKIVPPEYTTYQRLAHRTSHGVYFANEA
jgi:hypothetical protein